MKPDYYNENDPFAAAWLRNLIAAGHLPRGEVDERSIVDVWPDDLAGFHSCHFFAGIGGWAWAMRCAGWPEGRSLWSGSCPCQPFSDAGHGLGVADERHLWPEFRRLIAERRPAVVVGEQVASAAGREWLAGVRLDLEAVDYVVGAADLCSAGVSAPNLRQRIYWLAYADGDGWQAWFNAAARSIVEGFRSAPVAGRDVDWMVHPERAGLEGLARHGDDRCEPGRLDSSPNGSAAEAGGAGFWRQFDVAYLTDGTARRIEPGTFPLAHGIPARVGRLRGYGNAINAELAAEFLRVALEVMP